MSTTLATTLRNTILSAINTALGGTANLKLRLAGSVSVPGTAVATLPMSATPFGTPSGGSMTANAITSDTNATGNASAVSTLTLETGAGVVQLQADVGASTTTSVTGSSGAATIVVGSAAGLTVGMKASGTGIATGARIVNVNGTTITLTINNTGAVSGTGTFSYDANLTNGLIINPGDTVSCSSLVLEGP
jgi:hypothetical protein